MGLRGLVLAATDFSEAADAALRQGGEIASQLATRLVVCHVLPEAYQVRVLFPQEAGPDAVWHPQLEARAREVIASRLETVAPTMVEISVEIDSGTPHAGILKIAEGIGAGVVVLGPGRTAQHVARAVGGPVLVARPSPRGGSVLGATDFSDPSTPAVQMAAAEARRRGVKLRVVHCVDIDTLAYVPPAAVSGMLHLSPVPQSMIDSLQSAALEKLAAAMASVGTAGEAIVQRRPPAMGIVEAAQLVATSLVVVGTRGRTGLIRLALGSVAEAVMGQAPCSVLVVPLNPA